MPNVPRVPGVPALSGYAAGAGSLAVADALVGVAALGGVLQPQWGIYLNGAPVVQPANAVTQALGGAIALGASIAGLFGLPVFVTASFVEMEYKNDNPVSDYPVEDGGFQSYDKVQLPFDLRVRLACAGTTVQLQQFQDLILAMALDLNLYDVVTPDQVFSSVNCLHVDYRRTANNGVSMIVADLFFQEIRVTATSTFQSTQQPYSQSQVGDGAVGAATPTQAGVFPPPATDFW